MKKGVILYQSKYGATKKYAEWLQEATGFDCIETKKAKISDVEKYDVVILGGGVYASGILGFPFLKKHISRLKGKRVAVFCVGASPYDEKAIEAVRKLNFKDELSGVPLFYCRGAWNKDTMKFLDRKLCDMLIMATENQDPSTYEPWQKALMSTSGKNCDWTDRSYLEALIEFAVSE